MSGVLAVLSGQGAGGGGGGSGLAIDLNRVFIGGFANSSLPTTIQTSQSVTAAVSGGVPPYSGVWSRTSGDTSVNVTSTSSPTVYGTSYFSSFTDKTATFKYTVTDAAATVVDSEEVSVYLTANDVGGIS